MRFPFRATCIASTARSPLKKGDAVEVVRMAPEDVCSDEMLVEIRWQRRKFAVSLSQLAAFDADEPTAEAIADWHYWVAQGYLF
jgi:Calcium binding